MVHIFVTVTKIANRGNFKSLCSPITHEATSSHEILTLQHIDACFELNLKHTSHFRFLSLYLWISCFHCTNGFRITKSSFLLSVENMADWSYGILQRSDKAIETITSFNGMETYSLYSQAPLYWGLQLPACCDGSKSPVRWEPPQPPGGCWLSTASWASSWPPPTPCTCRLVSTGWRRMMGQRRPFPPCCWVETRRTHPSSLCLRELSAVMQLNPSQISGKMMT